MSGGVDSSVAAHLLLEQGHEVIGVFMRHGEQSPVACTSTPLPIVNRPDHKQGCCTAADAEDARRVADKLSIPFYALDLQQEFRQIIDYFVDEYTAGRTPNPCIVCNTWLKFGKLFEYADSIEASYVATGHHARIEPVLSGPPALVRGRDPRKDQSYVLFGIDRKLLRRILLPVGDYEKRSIRSMAAQLGLRVAEKKESQEICFVPNGDYAAFIDAYFREQGARPASRGGEIVNTEGAVLGSHDGVHRFTVGQRRGLGIATGEPLYVISTEPASRRVVVGRREELLRNSLVACGVNWVSVAGIDEPTRARVRIRHQHTAAPATLFPAEDPARVEVRFDEPQRAVTPGQAAVFYDGDLVLGGGWIS